MYIPLNFIVVPSEKLAEEMKTRDPVTYRRMEGRTAIGFKLQGAYVAFICAGVCLLIITLIYVFTIGYSIFGCYKFLRVKGNTLSRGTAALYSALINSLVLDMVMVGILCLVPTIAFVTSYALESPYAPGILSIALQMATVYPIVANIITIAFVTPYRRAMVRIIRKLFCGPRTISLARVYVSESTSRREITSLFFKRRLTAPLT
ncbi:serpentine type 7TM GPCR chemoreceptor srh domain-containing protein [Ditylenchus destructor]|uniref:Serpentine type 7TM GPCR chemoreceptor srh domain-containing protein n=1 Tax=Ditylenchus destructor TaxID=166010 RepID=A0AAD4MUW7_9BILA|nr:serpentine type 7TM GPCR chemoreceptor srh domain-containing protein [Ditylenchus destructor]